MLSSNCSFIAPQKIILYTVHLKVKGRLEAKRFQSLFYVRMFIPSNSNKLSLSPYLISSPELSIFDRLAPGQPYPYN